MPCLLVLSYWGSPLTTLLFINPPTGNQMPDFSTKESVEELVGAHHPMLDALRLLPHKARLEFVEEMDAEIEACTDPELKKQIELEHSVFRMMLRMWQPVEMSPEDEDYLNEHFLARPDARCRVSEEEQDHMDEYFLQENN